MPVRTVFMLPLSRKNDATAPDGTYTATHVHSALELNAISNYRCACFIHPITDDTAELAAAA